MGKVPTWTRLDLVDTFENQDRNAFEIWQKADMHQIQTEMELLQTILPLQHLNHSRMLI